MEIAVGIVGFVFFVLGALLQLLLIAIIVSAVLSWLFAFDVINHRNRVVNQIAGFLDAIVSPVLEPFRRMIPSLGGIDVSPIVVILIIRGLQIYLLPASQIAILSLIAGA